ncbi:MAG: hypothetical protein J5U16_06555, partial [Candidatus Methanoperedens sp.]|nr:hypothetical protein [Candidatus Methanoperedens sp.]
MLKYIFKKQVPKSFNSKDEGIISIKNRLPAILGIGVLLAVIILGGIANYFKIPLSVITLSGALILILFEQRIIYRLKRISWNVVIFVAGLFIVVKGLEVSNVADDIGNILFANISSNLAVATFQVSLLSAFMCNLVNNIPMTVMMLSITQHAALIEQMNTAMAYSLVIGSNLGANFTTFGALAGILWLESARRSGWSTTITDFLIIGLFVTPFAILASSIILSVEFLIF